MNDVSLPSISEKQFAGLLIGTAVGDSIGLPSEGLSKRRISKMWKGTFRQRFLFGKGMVSDDTEHAFFVGQALLSYPRDPQKFTLSLSWKLRFWLLGLPAGIGLATLKATLRLWLGVSPERSGIRSAGNGAAMRAPLLGLFFAHDLQALKSYVIASSRITHTDDRALAGAMAVALSARHAATNFVDNEALILELQSLCEDEKWRFAFKELSSALTASESVHEYASRLGQSNRVTGFVCHSVPVAIYAWLRHRHDFRKTITECISCGGDTDTTAAMAGALSGIDVGVAGIPETWRADICEWPRSLPVLTRLATQLQKAHTTETSQTFVKYFWPGLVLRNSIF